MGLNHIFLNFKSCHSIFFRIWHQMLILKIPLITHSLVLSGICLGVYYQYINATGCCFENLKYYRKDFAFTLIFTMLKKAFCLCTIIKKYLFRWKLTLTLCLIEQYIYLFLVPWIHFHVLCCYAWKML